MNIFKGTLLAMVCWLAGILSKPLVLLYAIRGQYPWWMITPDDLPREGAKHFGEYEPTVRKIYERFGRYWGDVYWLGFRNSVYGLSYYFKPDQFKGLTSYVQYNEYLDRNRWYTLYSYAGYDLLQIHLGYFEILLGWQVRGAVLNPLGQRTPINMEFRPMFSIRKAG